MEQQEVTVRCNGLSSVALKSTAPHADTEHKPAKQRHRLAERWRAITNNNQPFRTHHVDFSIHAA
jgi:hypothetical protein